MGGKWQARVSGNLFLSNPLHWRRAWTLGLLYAPRTWLSLELSATNTFGRLTPDSVFGSAFPQYRFQWHYHFGEEEL
jgi:hypothetical protein